MLARVVDITDGAIYLEIDSQIRFQADYDHTLLSRTVHPEDHIEFHFRELDGHPVVEVDAIISHISYRPPRLDLH
ncbi:hypothetical protein GF420_10135 [candidate division GN15 bacterium]|nr:hypothetical protein [candidate division GN15 bacterium]